eukprot:3441-Heterococcus_DN1.PRE.1
MTSPALYLPLNTLAPLLSITDTTVGTNATSTFKGVAIPAATAKLTATPLRFSKLHAAAQCSTPPLVSTFSVFVATALSGTVYANSSVRVPVPLISFAVPPLVNNSNGSVGVDSTTSS